MKILALETALNHCSVAIYTDRHLAYQRIDSGTKNQSQLILTMIDQVLLQQKLSLDAIDLIAFSRGPGSFSGVRINAAVAQALAWANQLPVATVSTLQAMAQAAYRKHNYSAVSVCIDARMGEVYQANYQFDIESATMQPSSEEQIISYAEAASFAKQLPIVGDGVNQIESDGDAELVIEAQDIAQLATSSPVFDNANDALPIYLRENAWKKITEQGQ